MQLKALRIAILSCGLFLVGSAGCGSKVVKDLEKIRDEMCACKDRDCAETAEKSYQEWTAANKKAKGSRSQRDDVEKALVEYRKCFVAAVDSGAAKPATKPETAPETAPEKSDGAAKPDDAK